VRSTIRRSRSEALKSAKDGHKSFRRPDLPFRGGLPPICGDHCEKKNKLLGVAEGFAGGMKDLGHIRGPARRPLTAALAGTVRLVPG